MNVTLIKYQEKAIAGVLEKLKSAREGWCSKGDMNAFSLSAVTGAGKTVMVASVIEHLLFGEGFCDFTKDSTAVVIWLSDDPSLNAQSFHRLQECSSRLDTDHMQVVESTFDEKVFSEKMVYFLNTQKLSKNSRLTRGHVGDDSTVSKHTPSPDDRSHTIWQTIRNTIEHPERTLYLILDEAHRGMRLRSNRDDESKSTIVQKLINGVDNNSGETIVPGIPIVLGISATVEHFEVAMRGKKNRILLPSVTVKISDVRDSGLIKDTILLDMPNKSGPFDTVLIRRGAAKLKEKTLAWENYTSSSNTSSEVIPLMVLQVPDKPKVKNIEQSLDVIFDTFQNLSETSVAHVFAEHVPQRFGKYNVQYIQPEDVQGNTEIRILIAKHAVNTGWDCPRAEVMVSFRRATDPTHIKQLLGRLMRSPLAKRIDGYDKLNAVDCILPYFDKNNVSDIVESLMSGETFDEHVSGQRVLLEYASLSPNPDIHNDVFDKFETLPTQIPKSRPAHAVDSLMKFSQALAMDDIDDGAVKWSEDKLHKALDGLCERYSDEIDEAIRKVLTIPGTTHKFESSGKRLETTSSIWESDSNVINDWYRLSSRKFTKGLATSYGEHLLTRLAKSDESKIVEAAGECRIRIAAIGSIDEIVSDIERDARKYIQKLNEMNSAEISILSNSRKNEYKTLLSESGVGGYDTLSLPSDRIESTAGRNGDRFLTYKKHLFCDNEGNYPDNFNNIEKRVLKAEVNRKSHIAWYRNPPRPVTHSLGIPFTSAKENKITRPDFIFFSQDREGEILASIVDPHGDFLGDFLGKAQGIARYAEKHGENYSRILVVLEGKRDGKSIDLSIDLNDESVRNIVLDAGDLADILGENCARVYC